MDVALVMQAKFDTYITGLASWQRPLTSGLMDGWVPDAIKKTMLETEKETLASVKLAWERAVQKRCIPDKTQWIETAGEAAS